MDKLTEKASQIGVQKIRDGIAFVTYGEGSMRLESFTEVGTSSAEYISHGVFSDESTYFTMVVLPT